MNTKEERRRLLAECRQGKEDAVLLLVSAIIRQGGGGTHDLEFTREVLEFIKTNDIYGEAVEAFVQCVVEHPMPGAETLDAGILAGEMDRAGITSTPREIRQRLEIEYDASDNHRQRSKIWSVIQVAY